MIKLKQFSQPPQPLSRGAKPPKGNTVLGARSVKYKTKTGKVVDRSLDENLNPNLGKELQKLQREKAELSRGIGGENAMATYNLSRVFSTTISAPDTKTYVLKRFSTTSKTYKIKRKTFGAVGDVANTVGNGLNRTVGTVENVAGGIASGTGKAMDSFVGKNVVGTTAGTIAGMALLPKLGMALGGIPGGIAGGILAPVIGGIGGGLLGRGIMKTGGKILKDVGEGMKDDAASRTA